MASRRTLKKAINNICSDLFADCVVLSMCEQGNAQQLQELMERTLVLHQEYISRISHAEKGNEKAYFKQLCDEFTQKANALSEEIIKA